MRTATAVALAMMAIAGIAQRPATAQEAPEAQAAAEAQLQQAYEEAMQAADKERQAALEAVERAKVELERTAEERARASAEAEAARERLGEQEAQRREEMEAMRSELSRAQEELRRASREVVRVHRELDSTLHPRAPAAGPGFSNRAVIGVILGDSNEDGVGILGVSPGGPAEKAGIRQGDVIVAVMGKPLAGQKDQTATQLLLEVMKSVKPGDELDITVQRDDGNTELTFGVVAEEREPVSWTTMLRLPSAPDAPGAPMIIEERIQVPRIDQEALAEKMAQLQADLEKRKIVIAHGDGPEFVAPEGWEFEFHNLSELGEDVMRSADVWFGMPMLEGLELAEVDQGLGEYFKTDHGVLVLKARDSNPLQLQVGDVLTAVAGQRVTRPADVMRELRKLEAGTPLELEIMRKRKPRTLELEVPELSRPLGFAPEAEHSYHYRIEVDSDR